MNHPIEVIAYHGWGFDSSCWADWKTWFTHRQILFKAFDRGYFGTAQTPVFTSDPDKGYKVLLVHSYGLHLCPLEQLKQADLLIVLSSFIEFHPVADRPRRRSQRILHQMIQECREQPRTVLQSFYNRCDCSMEYSELSDHLQRSDLRYEWGAGVSPLLGGHCPHAPFHNPFRTAVDSKLLVADLEELNVSQLDLSVIKTIPKTVIFHGLMDQIVASEKGQELFDRLGDKAEYFAIQPAGHALPFTHAQPCWKLLAPQL